MYNPDRKQRFIEQCTDNDLMQKNYITLFNAIAPFEEELNTDVCFMDQQSLQHVVDSLFGTRFKSRITKFRILRDYIRWCSAIGLDGVNGYIFDIDVYGIERLKRMTVSCPLALNTFLNILYSPESKRTMDNVYRCFLWLAFSGMKEEDALKVKVANIKFNMLTIEYNGRSYPIYPEALPALRNCVSLKSFYYDHPNYNDGVKVFKNRVPGDLLLRGVKTQPQSNAFRTELTKRNRYYINSGETKQSLSYTRVWLSGIFYRMYLREMAGYPVDFEGLVSELLLYEGLVSTTNTTAFKRKVREYMIDYERWKLTFI